MVRTNRTRGNVPALPRPGRRNSAAGVILVVSAHPYPDRSIANRALSSAIADLGGVERRSLYELYPDLCVDAEAEQRALVEAHTVVWQHPLYWYSVPALLKLWFEKVLARGWAYGSARALAGKACLWVATTGGELDAYASDRPHGEPFDEFEPPVRQTARFCGMRWLEPMIVHGAHQLSSAELAARGAEYRARLVSLGAREGSADE